MRDRRQRCRITLIATAIAIAGVAAGPVQGELPPPVSSFAELPPISDVDLSPDGARLVMLRAIGETYHAVVADLQAGEMRPLMAADPDRFLFNWCRWANNERVVCSIRSYSTIRAGQMPGVLRRYRDGRAVLTRLLAINADGSEELQLVPDAITRPGEDLEWNAPRQDEVVSWLPDDPDHILIQLRRDAPNNPAVYRLNVYTNRMYRKRRPHDSVLRWYADRNGDLRLAGGYRNTHPVAFSVHRNRLSELDLSGLSGILPPTVAGFANDGASGYVFANHGRDRRSLYRVETRTGAVIEELFADPDYDVIGKLFLHPGTGEPLALNYHREGPETKWFDDRLAARFDRLRQALPGVPSRMALVSVDEPVQRLVFTTEGNGTLPRYYLFDRSRPDALTLLAESYGGLDAAIEPRLVSYEARDGLHVPAYLTLPGDVAPEGELATVVMPHGGPWSRETAAFDYWVQLLVSRGYAVLQPNFRGSTGYGDRFLAAGFREWGQAMQEDLIDGLDWLIEEGIADPDRVCIVGGSYGGYAALVAAYKTPKRFRCAVSFAGVSDLDEFVVRQWNMQLGEVTIARIPEGKAREDNSPLSNVDSLGVPLLIVHGDLDRSVMIDQSRLLVEALEAAGKPYRYIEQANGDHFLSRQSHRTEFLAAMEAFVAEHLGRSTSTSESGVSDIRPARPSR